TTPPQIYPLSLHDALPMARITTAPRSSGRTSFKAPRYLPIGVRTPSTIETPFICSSTRLYLCSHIRLFPIFFLIFLPSHIVQVVEPVDIFLLRFHINILNYSVGRRGQLDRRAPEAPLDN